MKIKLIAPAKKPEWGENFWDFRTLCSLSRRKAAGPALALPTLAALVPVDIEVSITDESVEPVNFDEQIDLVGITFLTSLAPRAYEIADKFRARGITVVLGGIHASMLPEEAIQHADSVVIGEAEDVLPQLIKDFREGKLRKFYHAPCFPDLANSPVPAWHLLEADNYSYFTLQTGRGCPYDCDFCSVKVFNGRKYRQKPIENVVKEARILKEIDPRKAIFFTDDNILAEPTYARDLFRSLIPLAIKWWCQASVNRLKDDSLLELMYQSGCREVFVGFESLSQKSLGSMGKSKINRVAEYEEIVDKVHSHGIAIFGSFILGSDQDDPGVFDTLIKFINDAKIAFSMINILTPSPGTSLFQRFELEKRLLHRDWWKYDGEHVCFMPKSFSIEALQENRDRVLREINSYEALYGRFRTLWDQGVFVRDREGHAPLFTKGRILFTLKSLLWGDPGKTWFALKSLWNPKATSITPVLLALNFHDYANSSEIDDPRET